MTNMTNEEGRMLAGMAEEGLKNVISSLHSFGEIVRYCMNDINIFFDAYLWALPNNQRKRMGLPLKRHRALRKIRRKVYCVAETKEVHFNEYCPLCKHEKLDDDSYPCRDCLTQGYNYDSHKPIFWEEKEKN